MKIVQILPSLAYGDAISNETFALRNCIMMLGYETDIYAESIQPPLSKKEARTTNRMPSLRKDDVVIYHLATGTKLAYKFAKLECRKIIIYHNITPPKFFENYNEVIRRINVEGLEEARFLADKVDYCIADSDYNKQELIRLGYRCPIVILPILLSFSDYEKEPYQEIVKRYQDDKVNVLFTGRVVPNKNFEGIIKAFTYYKKYFEQAARLFLVGNEQNAPVYYEMLQSYVNELGVKDVYFTGHINFNRMLAYYHIADIFLCMSKHEGFCVPLVEAMYFDIPIVAAATSAIPYTLGGSGILMKSFEPLYVAKIMDRLMKDKTLKDAVLSSQRVRLSDFSYERVVQQFKKILEHIIGEKY